MEIFMEGIFLLAKSSNRLKSNPNQLSFPPESSGSFNECHCAIGLLGEANMSIQCRSSVPEALHPSTAFGKKMNILVTDQGEKVSEKHPVNLKA